MNLSQLKKGGPARLEQRLRLPIYCLLLPLSLTMVVSCSRRVALPPAAATSERAAEDLKLNSSQALGVLADAKYVGDDACTPCHEDIAKSYRRHPMGQSLAPIHDALAVERFDGEANNPFLTADYRYDVRMQNGQTTHVQTRLSEDGKAVVRIEQPVHFAVGSGRRGRSYLANQDGFLFMSPITWYPEKGIWDVSPGYERSNLEFSRGILEDCLFCHANRANLVQQMTNRYTKPIFSGYAIGCERCHGPGELHVQRHQAGQASGDGEDLTIVNPARLDADLREAVCQQCHLSGVARVPRHGRRLYDFRPGLPLESTIATYVLHPGISNDAQFVGQVEQMYASRCYRASDGKLGCISCHDPHALPPPDQRVDHFRRRCLNCHQPDHCALPLSERSDADGTDNCIQCHMPVLQTEVRHAATTDHRIPRTQDSRRGNVDQKPLGVGLPIVVFPPRRQPGDSIDLGRDVAIALIQTSLYHPRLVTPLHHEIVLNPLKQAVSRDADDVDAQNALGQILWKLGETEEALNVFQQASTSHPGHEQSLVLYAHALSASGDHNAAAGHWQRAVELNPWMPRYWFDLANAYSQLGRWPECLATSREAVRRFPTHIGIRQLLVASHMQLGDVKSAEAEFDKILQFNPREMPAIQQWFDSHPSRQSQSRRTSKSVIANMRRYSSRERPHGTNVSSVNAMPAFQPWPICWLLPR